MTSRTTAAQGAADAALSPEQFVRFRDLIEERCGLHLDAIHRVSLGVSLRIRMKQLDLDEVDDYYDHLRNRPADEGFGTLINLLTVTETCFFRDPSQFRLIRDHILPRLLAERAAGKKGALRIWSAGCSTGEEAYSIALTLWDMGLYQAYPPGTFEILGTDVNTEALHAARRGTYSARALRNVDGDCLRKHFRSAGPAFHLNDEVKRRVRFEYGNLTRTPVAGPASGHDVVLCKNVAIYFRPERAHRLVRDLYEMVNDGGYLLLGHSESLWEMAGGFTLVEHGGVFCYHKGAATPEAEAPKGRPQRSPARLKRPKAPSPPARSQPSAETAGGQYDRCLAAFRAESWAQAESCLEGLIASSPQFVPAYLLLGGVYAHRGRYDEAREQARLVLHLDDLEPRGHLLQGMIAAWSGREDEARAALRRALYLNDSLALGHFWLGNLYRERGDLGRACSEYENVVHDWERHTLDFTEEFASDLCAEQVVQFCRDSLQRLRPGE